MIFQPIEEFNELEFFLPLKSVNLRNMGQVSSNVVHYAKGQHLFLRQFHTDLDPKIIFLTFFSFFQTITTICCASFLLKRASIQLKYIHFKRRAFLIFTLHQSNTFVGSSPSQGNIKLVVRLADEWSF